MSLKEEGNSDTEKETQGGRPVTTDADVGVVQLQAKECQGLPVTSEARKRQACLPVEPTERVWSDSLSERMHFC